MKRYLLIVCSFLIGIVGALLKLETTFQYYWIILLIGAIGFIASIVLLVVKKK